MISWISDLTNNVFQAENASSLLRGTAWNKKTKEFIRNQNSLNWDWLQIYK